jgi:hypothetical protein
LNWRPIVDDDDLREEFNVLLAPIRAADPPAMSVIRRRLRRRRVMAAAGGSAVAVAVAVTALAWHAAVTLLPAVGRPTPSAAPMHTSSIESVPGGHEVTVAYGVSAPVSTLVIDGSAGAVSITGSRRTTVSVTEYRYYSSAQPATSHAVNGSTLTLSYTCPAERDCGVAYAVKVPRGIAVRVRYVTGAIRLSGLAGPITAATGTGAIDASGLASTTVTLSTRTGAISAGFTKPPTALQASTGTGEINIGVPDTVRYNVTAEASTYIVNVNTDTTSPYAITARAGIGDITVVPGAPSASPSDAARSGINDCSGNCPNVTLPSDFPFGN